MNPHRNDGVRAFAPGSVGNIGVGFDLLGHSVAGPRDVAIVRRIEEPTVRIDAIRGAVAGADRLPLQPPELNTAGRARWGSSWAGQRGPAREPVACALSTQRPCKWPSAMSWAGGRGTGYP